MPPRASCSTQRLVDAARARLRPGARHRRNRCAEARRASADRRQSGCARRNRRRTASARTAAPGSNLARKARARSPCAGGSVETRITGTPGYLRLQLSSTPPSRACTARNAPTRTKARRAGPPWRVRMASSERSSNASGASGIAQDPQRLRGRIPHHEETPTVRNHFRLVGRAVGRGEIELAPGGPRVVRAQALQACELAVEFLPGDRDPAPGDRDVRMRRGVAPDAALAFDRRPRAAGRSTPPPCRACR